eukprot:NODE_3803_length_896_cov_26.793238_g3650_i0.p2 GENE.NODE_3803_length_896_cov_26.793238_g3650_i0~~NODE_3803_length_896_cov_26.793238_g3650_i0.p2  ORF type:complete len:139 (-),score=34.88 NODE_3803_length_896_cov_26.793238_g3650_i0:80-496(-)
MMGARVVLTDFEEVLTHTTQNIERNRLLLTGSVTVKPLDWGCFLPELWTSAPFDCILASDVLASHYNTSALLNVIRHFCINDCTALLCYETRPDEPQSDFLARAAPLFTITTIPAQELDATYQSEDIHLLRMKPIVLE